MPKSFAEATVVSDLNHALHIRLKLSFKSVVACLLYHMKVGAKHKCSLLIEDQRSHHWHVNITRMADLPLMFAYIGNQDPRSDEQMLHQWLPSVNLDDTIKLAVAPRCMYYAVYPDNSRGIPKH